MHDISMVVDGVEYSFVQTVNRPGEIILFKDNVSCGRISIEKAFEILTEIATNRVR